MPPVQQSAAVPSAPPPPKPKVAKQKPKKMAATAATERDQFGDLIGGLAPLEQGIPPKGEPKDSPGADGCLVV